MLVSCLNMLTFLWLFLLGWFAVRRIARQESPSIDYALLVHFSLCGFPLLLDDLIGIPNYTSAPGFVMAAEDKTTAIIYCLYVAWVPLVWLKVGRPSRSHPEGGAGSTANPLQKYLAWHIPPFLRLALVVIMVSPLIMILFLPDRSLYWVFSSTLRYFQSDTYMRGHVWVTRICYFSVVAACWLLLDSHPWKQGRWPNLLTSLFVSPWLICTVWLHGKRNVVAILCLLLLFVFYFRGLMRGKRAYVLVGAGLTGLLCYSFFFQVYTGRVSTTYYENFRIDYGRDAVIKMAIFAELHPDEIRILEYRGQSLLYYLLCWVPRDKLANKPMPYAQYVTSAKHLSEPRFWEGGMTTSWLEESIANFGWGGLLIGPMGVALFFRIGDSCRDGLLRLLTPLLGCLLLAVHMIAVFPLFVLWGGLVIWARPWRKNARQRGCIVLGKDTEELGKAMR